MGTFPDVGLSGMSGAVSCATSAMDIEDPAIMDTDDSVSELEGGGKIDLNAASVDCYERPSGRYPFSRLAAVGGFSLALFTGCSGVPYQSQQASTVSTSADPDGDNATDAGIGDRNESAAPDADVLDRAVADLIDAPISETSSGDARQTDRVCGDADSAGIQLLVPNFPGVACGATVSLPSKSLWFYFKDPDLCSHGERVYKFEWTVDLPKPVVVGAGTFAPATGHYYRPSLGMGSNCPPTQQYCSGLLEPVFPQGIKNWRAWKIPERNGRYWVLACIPERPVDGGVSEQTFHIRAVGKDGQERQCCIHLR